MAELLVSNGNGRAWEAGMILEVQEDGWGWTQTERDSLALTILELPGVLAADLLKYREAKISPAFRRRRLKLDTTQLTAGFLQRLADAGRSSVQRVADLAGVEVNVA